MTDLNQPGVHQRPAPGRWPEPPAPTRADLQWALRIVGAAHRPTPLIKSHQLSQRTGKDVYLKLEGTSAVRSFKYRGALAALARHVAESPGKTVFTASTGNHGQGIAFAGTRLGVEVVVCSPETTLPEKVAAMEVLGATVEIGGTNLTHAENRARQMAKEGAGVYIEDGDSPHLMAGASTVASEILDEIPDIDTLVVPVGGGNLISATLLAVAARQSDVIVIGVQSTAAPGATESWLRGEISLRDSNTFAGGLATERPGRLSLAVMSSLLETMVLVDDEDLQAASGDAFRSLGLVVEGAGAAPLAALDNHLHALEGQRIALTISGSWLSEGQLSRALAWDNR